MAAYHKGYTKEQRKDVDRSRKRKARTEKTETDVRTKEVIVWDGEGMKLSGNDMPQHYVLFGCSAEPDSPLVIKHPTGHLSFEQIADYCLSVVKKHPHAIHLGYFFKYDQNMIIQSLHWIYKRRLYSENYCRYPSGNSVYYISIKSGKTIVITRVRGDEKVTIKIEDFAPFFASSFVAAYQTLFPQPTDPENWAIVEQGKRDRADMLYEDMPKVRRYWRAEIIALQELAFEFRRLMFNGDFMLNEWHGPGALANYIRRNYDLIKHEYGGKEANMPPEMLTASRGAYFGGRFEQFKVGYIHGPIYNYDINSAYPHAFCQIPSLSEGGIWQRLGPIDKDVWRHDHRLRTSFSVFNVRWNGPGTSDLPIANRIIQPLPHRARRAHISYPQFTTGWYWSPEVSVAMTMAIELGVECEIIDGWTWIPAEETYPWNDVLVSMYARRLQLKDNKNPTQMAFKLGPNSMYGKAAQRVGGKDKPPASHTLPIAGFITSTCRAMVMEFMRACRPDSVISVETDGVFTTTPPDKLRRKERFPLSKNLGEWEFKQYDAMVLLQNGVYLLLKDGEWSIKSRGIPVDIVDPEYIMGFLSECKGDSWPVLQFQSRESFLTLATSVARSTIVTKSGKRRLISAKAKKLHCTWVSNERELNIEGHNSKREHHSRWCRSCARGLSAAETAHDMVIHSEATVDFRLRESNLYQLPWMKEYIEPEWILGKQQDGDEYDD